MESGDKKGNFILPANIVKEGELFSQTLSTPNQPNMCLFNLDIAQWMGKLRVVVTNLQAGAKLTFGIIRK